MTQKHMHSISKQSYLSLAQAFHWATKEHYQLMLTGKLERHSRTEKVLPKLVAEKKLIALPYDNRLVYALTKRGRGGNTTRYKIEHGLACTGCLVRIWLSKPKGELIPEKHFTRRFPIIPEWGIRYPTGTLLLFEFATADNFARGSLMESKVRRYTECIDELTAKFEAQKSVVLMVADTDREKVKRFVETHSLPDFLFLTDLTTFKMLSLGLHLTTPIYLWKDGKEYPLSHA